MKIRAIRHVRGFDVARPISIGVMLGIMLPLVLLPLLSIFVYGTNKGLGTFWSALVAPEAIFALSADRRMRYRGAPSRPRRLAPSILPNLIFGTHRAARTHPMNSELDDVTSWMDRAPTPPGDPFVPQLLSRRTNTF